MKTLNRRALFVQAGGALMGAALLSGCVTTKQGTQTKLTINVAKINAYIQAGLNAAATVTGVVSMIPVLAVYSAPVKKVTELLQAVQVSFTAAVGDRLEFAYNDASVMTIVNSALDAIEQVGDLIKKIFIDVMKSTLSASATDVSKVEVTYNSIMTIISVFKALITTSFVSNDNVSSLNVRYAQVERKALTALQVRV